ncbi:bifunctional [glutamate--ammonia ligase]-adenylyl-L-tyrosine phosphorylase/[glutamate--ammonia-ligase] adenylyltransferase [Pseudoluteimonas lycopersici]|uniref:Bifunctional glutamine synthetase adenylyltransferase/adenylyl-removing enzyme n=1 Tax=Pseudoluteimonas lycopersici TaxID=1324796 RepID=A0A516V5B9_9GAMM|nr:bifunctional [glutamate--ammonia ligase]-adenylyl-L-tyrosine phosphorylase/[glutamate--ammonia-ligase] adenylyltransferase [Lysobacter lycopersici]QDQ73724.1 bifunctional [glutamate--ammonia ligase]-adenylyl-L-tyrosine phosphorylase/[glutamate--ammonia-ligase] adenylyltransferase [Lysobacter lycopersici]
MDRFAPLIARRLASLPADAPWRGDAAFVERLGALAVASDFAMATLAAQPGLVERLHADNGIAAIPPPRLAVENRTDWPRLLRRHRQAESTRLAWRDVVAGDAVETILAGSSALAETCLRLALAALEGEFAERHGVVRDGDGVAQSLVVFGLGKLGGGELNFSSDIDLVYAYERDGESDGPRPLAAEDYFSRLGQRLAKLLDEVTADGFSHRVDLRLRPYGNAGRIAWSFAALEQYFQREGRDWERYAWQKARPVAGDPGAGERFLETLRPFVYRRYLDFGALAGLREMKAMIAAEVARKDMADDIKRGPGGIREIEFLAQALQLIRGGREAALRERRLLPALDALVAAGQVAPQVGVALAEAYRFLRTVENRLQMLRDAQVHRLPQGEEERARLATGMGFADWSGLLSALDARRERVAAEFNALLGQRRRDADAGELAGYWRALPAAGDARVLSDAGFEDATALDASLRDFVRAPGVHGLADAVRARLDRVAPSLLQASAASSQPDAALRRVLALLQNILRRSSYLALLDEQPAALARLVDVVARSGLLAERLTAHPLLLDELLDARLSGPLPQREELQAECAPAVAEADGDLERALHALNEKRQALGFRIALATLDGRQCAVDGSRQLAWLADAVVASVLRLAQAEVERAHGKLPSARFAVLGYGSLGGEELGFGSDLDLVFLFDADANAQSDGMRALDAPRWYARLAQKIVALLDTPTAGGRLYEVDVRLRPDGAKGLLVSSLASFSDYQRERAWTWEHQALVRARFVAGDASLGAAFEAIRAETLSKTRDAGKLAEEVSAMRKRMRAELDRSDAARFDLKQGEGGLVDLEFLLQFLVLRDAGSHAAWLMPRDTPGLLRALDDAGSLSNADALHEAHAALLDAGLRCTLDRRKRLLPWTEVPEAARSAISAAVRGAGLVFDAS